MMEHIPWLRPRPYVGQRLDLRKPAGAPAIAPAARALFTAPFRDSGDAPCAACAQADTRRTRRKVTDDAFLMLCDDVRACNLATTAAVA